MSGTIDVEWKLIPNAELLNETQLEAASDAVGAFRFARPEDGAFNNLNRNEFFFVTTGGAADVNELGRLYSLELHPGNPIKGGELTVVYNADTVIADGGDIAISPDNIDVSDDYLMINEDGTAESRIVMAEKGRDGSIWRFDLDRHGVDASSAERVVELDPPGRDGIAGRPRHLGDERHHRRRGAVRGGLLDLRRPGASADHASGAEHRRRRAAPAAHQRRRLDVQRFGAGLVSAPTASLAANGALLPQLLADLARSRAELTVLLVVVGDRAQEENRLALGRAVAQAEDREPAHSLVVVVRRQLVEQRTNLVDEPGMVAREQLERDQRRSPAGRALVLDPAAEQLGLLPEAELPDRPVGDGALPVVVRAGRGLELVGPLRAQPGQLALRALLRERGSLRSG